MTDGIGVTVTDVDMKFTSMVRFMVKWAFASIPAMIFVGFVVYGMMVVIPRAVEMVYFTYVTESTSREFAAKRRAKDVEAAKPVSAEDAAANATAVEDAKKYLDSIGVK
jgi:hypothetical protein